MTSAYARIAVTGSFVVMSIIGAGFVFSYWSSQSITTAAGCSILFLVIIACVHLAGYILYVRQDSHKLAKAVPPQASFQYSASYWPALKVAIVGQVVLGILTALMLDGGRTFGFFKVALLGHWIGILMIIGRRPLAPIKWDLFFIRWGVLLLLIVAGLVAPLVWAIIGESSLSGWQRLRG